MDQRGRLSDLDSQEQDEVVRQRLYRTRLLRELAKEHPRDQIIQGANNLDIMAKMMDVYVEYNEQLDPEDDFPMW